MKKALLFICAAMTLAACTPTTPSTTDGSDTTKVDSQAVAQPTPGTDSASTDSGATASTDPGASDPGTGTNTGTPTNNTGNTSGNNTGRQANPNGNLGGKTFTVSGNITVISPYCGGAAPTPDMVEAAKTPQPYANAAFIVRQGNSNNLGTSLVTRVMTDATGKFSVTLAPGSYCMALAEKENKRTAEFLATKYYEIDKKCDDKWLTGCDLSFTVADKNISGLRLTLTRKCNINSFSPCIQWGGPLPSSPAPRLGK